MVPAYTMKTLLILIIASFACLPVQANTPKKEPLVKYTGLWTNSPFTSKPPPVTLGETVNPFDDFTLTGIAPVPGGHRITIISKKNPEIKKVIEPGGSDEFKVVSVNRNPDKALGTTVVLSSGSTQGTVTFEPELITLAAAPVAPVAQPPNTIPPGVVPANPNPQAQTGQRLPRPRIVPPPTATTASTAPKLPTPPIPSIAPANQQNQNQPSGDRRDSRRR
jgi:hypothetical protein